MQNRHCSQTFLECINSVLSVTFRSSELLLSSTYMKKVNDVTDWLSQTTDIEVFYLVLKKESPVIYSGFFSGEVPHLTLFPFFFPQYLNHLYSQ